MYFQRKRSYRRKCIHKINNFFVRDAKKLMDRLREDFQEEEGQRQNKKKKQMKNLLRVRGDFRYAVGGSRLRGRGGGGATCRPNRPRAGDCRGSENRGVEGGQDGGQNIQVFTGRLTGQRVQPWGLRHSRTRVPTWGSRVQSSPGLN